MTVEFGQCVNHGYVVERCCSLFEPRRAQPFLAPAMAAVGGAEGVRQVVRNVVRETLGRQGLTDLAERHLDFSSPPPGHPAYREPDISADEWRKAYFALVEVAKRQIAAAVRAQPVVVDGDLIGRAMHEASQVGGPWTPCTAPYNQWPECEHQPMGRHVAEIATRLGAQP